MHDYMVMHIQNGYDNAFDFTKDAPMHITEKAEVSLAASWRLFTDLCKSFH